MRDWDLCFCLSIDWVFLHSSFSLSLDNPHSHSCLFSLFYPLYCISHYLWWQSESLYFSAFSPPLSFFSPWLLFCLHLFFLYPLLFICLSILFLFTFPFSLKFVPWYFLCFLYSPFFRHSPLSVSVFLSSHSRFKIFISTLFLLCFASKGTVFLYILSIITISMTYSTQVEFP